jgi:hypothetical protein
MFDVQHLLLAVLVLLLLGNMPLLLPPPAPGFFSYYYSVACRFPALTFAFFCVLCFLFLSLFRGCFKPLHFSPSFSVSACDAVGSAAVFSTLLTQLIVILALYSCHTRVIIFAACPV